MVILETNFDAGDGLGIGLVYGSASAYSSAMWFCLFHSNLKRIRKTFFVGNEENTAVPFFLCNERLHKQHSSYVMMDYKSSILRM